MSDRMTLLGKSLGFLIAWFETNHDKWFVLRYNDTLIERTRDSNTYMLEIDDGFLTKLHYQGITYSHGKQLSLTETYMSEEIMIDPNEELDCYVGMNINEVENDLCDKNVSYRVRALGKIFSQECNPNRINLEVDQNGHVVTKAFYG